MRYLCFFYQLPLFYEGIWPCSGIWIKKGNLTYQMVRRLEKSGELSKETVFIDGTKLEACFNKYTFVWKKSVGKWEAKMYGRIQEAVRLLNQEYLCQFCVGEETRTRELQEICRSVRSPMKTF